MKIEDYEELLKGDKEEKHLDEPELPPPVVWPGTVTNTNAIYNFNTQTWGWANTYTTYTVGTPQAWPAFIGEPTQANIRNGLEGLARQIYMNFVFMRLDLATLEYFKTEMIYNISNWLHNILPVTTGTTVNAEYNEDNSRMIVTVTFNTHQEWQERIELIIR